VLSRPGCLEKNGKNLKVERREKKPHGRDPPRRGGVKMYLQREDKKRKKSGTWLRTGLKRIGVARDGEFRVDVQGPAKARTAATSDKTGRGGGLGKEKKTPSIAHGPNNQEKTLRGGLCRREQTGENEVERFA